MNKSTIQIVTKEKHVAMSPKLKQKKPNEEESDYSSSSDSSDDNEAYTGNEV